MTCNNLFIFKIYLDLDLIKAFLYEYIFEVDNFLVVFAEEI